MTNKVTSQVFVALQFVMAMLDRAIFFNQAISFFYRPTPERDGPVKPGYDDERWTAITWRAIPGARHLSAEGLA